MDECALEGVEVCDVNAQCFNEVGGFDCSCHVGFSGDGFNCGEEGGREEEERGREEEERGRGREVPIIHYPPLF